MRGIVSNVVDLGYSFRPVKREDFDQCLRHVRVTHRQRLDQRVVKRGPLTLGTVFLVGEAPVAFCSIDGTHYVRAT